MQSVGSDSFLLEYIEFLGENQKVPEILSLLKSRNTMAAPHIYVAAIRHISQMNITDGLWERVHLLSPKDAHLWFLHYQHEMNQCGGSRAAELYFRATKSGIDIQEFQNLIQTLNT
jgi:hypothetical protein